MLPTALLLAAASLAIPVLVLRVHRSILRTQKLAPPTRAFVSLLSYPLLTVVWAALWANTLCRFTRFGGASYIANSCIQVGEVAVALSIFVGIIAWAAFSLDRQDPSTFKRALSVGLQAIAWGLLSIAFLGTSVFVAILSTIS